MGQRRGEGAHEVARVRRERVLAVLRTLDGMPATAYDVWSLLGDPDESRDLVQNDLRLFVKNGFVSSSGTYRSRNMKYMISSKGRRARTFVDQTTLRQLQPRTIEALRLLAERGPFVESSPKAGDASKVWTRMTGLAAPTAYYLSVDGFVVVTKPSPIAKRTTMIELTPAGLLVAEGKRPTRAEVARVNHGQVVVRTVDGPKVYPKPPPGEVLGRPSPAVPPPRISPHQSRGTIAAEAGPVVVDGVELTPVMVEATWFDHAQEVADPLDDAHEMVAEPAPAAVEDPIDRVLDLAHRIKDAEHLVASLRAELAAVVAGIRP